MPVASDLHVALTHKLCQLNLLHASLNKRILCCGSLALLYLRTFLDKIVTKEYLILPFKMQKAFDLKIISVISQAIRGRSAFNRW